MGRPMGGSGGGSGGGFRPTRPSGGSSGGRPMGGGSMGGGSMGGGRPSGGGHRSPPPPPPPSRRPPPPPPRYGGGYGGGYGAPPPGGGYRRSRGGCLSGIISAVVLLFIVGMLIAANTCLNLASCLGCASSGNDSGANYDQKPTNSAPANPSPSNNNGSQTTVTKNSPANPFNEDCVMDETGWFENPTKLGKDLEFFYNKYGIQPYVVFKTYDSSVTTDTQRQSYCKEWYSKNIKDSDTFLVMYFSEKSDDEVGYFAYWGGSNVDKSANILEKFFEEGINKYWFNENLSLDDVMLNSFKYAANKVKVK